MKQVKIKTDQRTIEQIREHYEIEKSLAKKLLSANKNERRNLYGAVYDELFRRIPNHPQLVRKSSEKERDETIAPFVAILRKFLSKDTIFLEVGAGDCKLSFKIAELVKKVYAVDVSEEITSGSSTPANFKLLLSDGCSIPVPDQSIDIIFSNQLMEHLHPDDVLMQLNNIHKALKQNGIYFCITPNRLAGPCDISKYFDTVATGLHLKEYTNSEMERLFRSAGFSTIKILIWLKGLSLLIPLLPAKCLEGFLARLPASMRRHIAQFAPIHSILGVTMVAKK